MIIGIAGPIASGKSTLSRALARVFSLELVGVGEFVRHEAKARGLDASNRRVLQDFGQSLVSEDVKSFVRGVFGLAKVQPTDRVVLDGVRHHFVWDELVAFASSSGTTARLIFLKVPESERRKRLIARGISVEQILVEDRHATEIDVHTGLAEKADICLDALQEQDAMLAYIGSQLAL